MHSSLRCRGAEGLQPYNSPAKPMWSLDALCTDIMYILTLTSAVLQCCDPSKCVKMPARRHAHQADTRISNGAWSMQNWECSGRKVFSAQDAIL